MEVWTSQIRILPPSPEPGEVQDNEQWMEEEDYRGSISSEDADGEEQRRSEELHGVFVDL